MLPFSIGFGELVLIVVVTLLVVGPSRLPQIARTLAGAFKMARRATRELQDAISAEELKEPLVRPWQEVVKARDDMVDSLMRDDESDIEDAEMLDAECDGTGATPQLDAKPVEVKPVETVVKAVSAATPMTEAREDSSAADVHADESPNDGSTNG